MILGDRKSTLAALWLATSTPVLAIKTFSYDNIEATTYYGSQMVPVASCAAGLMNKGLYVFGGRKNGGAVSSDLHVYDFPTLTWSKLEYPPDPNGNPDITARERSNTIVWKDFMWIIGGTKNASATGSAKEISDNAYDSVYYYDYTQNFFQFIPSSGTTIPKAWGYSSTVLSDKFYFFGQYAYSSSDPCGKGSNDLYEYDPATFNWRFVPTGLTPPGRFGAALAGFNDLEAWPYSLIVFGGAENNCGSYHGDMYKVTFNDISSDDEVPDWLWVNYTSFSPVEPYGQAFMQVSVEKDAMYIYGGVRGNLQKSVLKNVWEFNATTSYWRPMVKVEGAQPFACSANLLQTGKGTPIGSASNYTSDLLWVSYGGYYDVSAKPYKIDDRMNVLYTLASPTPGLLTTTQLLWIEVLGPIVAAFLILLVIYFYRRNQEFSQVARIRMAYKPSNAYANPNAEAMLAGLKDGEVPEDPAQYFQMLQKNTQSQMTGKPAPNTASVYAPYGSAPIPNSYSSAALSSSTQNGYSGPQSAPSTAGFIPGVNTYGNTSYGNAPYGGAYAGYAGQNGATMIDEIGSVSSPTIGSTQPMLSSDGYGSTIIEDVGSTNGYNGNTMIAEVGYSSGPSTAPMNNFEGATMIEEIGYTSNPSTIPMSNYEEATMIEEVGGYNNAATNTLIDTAQLMQPEQQQQQYFPKQEAATLVEQAEIVEPVPEIAVETSETTEVQEEHDQTMSATQIERTAFSPAPNDEEAHIEIDEGSELISALQAESIRSMAEIESAELSFPTTLSLPRNLKIAEEAISAGDIVTDLWSGPIRVTTLASDMVSDTVSENMQGATFGNVKFWAPKKNVPEDVVEVLARRELLVLGFLRSTPNVVQLVGYLNTPFRVFTSFFTSTLHKELHDPSNAKWDRPEIKRAVIGDLINGFLYVHGKGIIHNRFNPKAVFLQYSEEKGNVPTAVIGDFSCATMVGNEPENPLNVGAFVSMQYRYVAPEILQNMKPSFAEMTRICSQASDVYSFGMVTYEIITTSAPFASAAENEARGRILAGEQPVIPTDLQAAFSSYAELVRRATQHDPDQRPTDFLQIRQMLE